MRFYENVHVSTRSMLMMQRNNSNNNNDDNKGGEYLKTLLANYNTVSCENR